MRRRRVLALGTAAVGFPGCAGIATTNTRTTDARTTPTEATDRASTATEPGNRGAVTPSIGGSLNGRPYRLEDDLGMVERSNARWLHAFLDVRKKYDQDVTPEDDPDIIALRRAGREMGAKLFVSLQWNFVGIFGEQDVENLPPSGSDRETALIEYATELLTVIGEPVNIIGVGNEPVWETLDEDFMGRDSPLISFTRTLKEHLVEHYTAGDPRLVLGAFNRLYSEPVRKEFQHFYRQLFDMARNDDDIDGIDLHIHYRAFQQARKMLDVARREFPDGLITVTEFSPIWRYDEHKSEPITTFEGGDRFAERYGVDDDVTVAEYFEAAKYDRISRREIADFYDVMPWYNVNFVDDMYHLLDEYDVEIGTFGFLVESDVRQLDWTEEWAPFPINCLFQPALIDTEDGAHPHYLDDFRDRV